MTTDRQAEDTLTTILEIARKRIDTPAKWTQGALARDAEGLSCSALSARAACMCTEGAVQVAVHTYLQEMSQEYEDRACGDGRSLEMYAREVLFEAARKHLPLLAEERHGVVSINDARDTEHHHIMTMFTEAIRELGE